MSAYQHRSVVGDDAVVVAGEGVEGGAVEIVVVVVHAGRGEKEDQPPTTHRGAAAQSISHTLTTHFANVDGAYINSS